jgi:hypothetical protein
MMVSFIGGLIVQHVAKSIGTCKKTSLYNQPRPYFSKYCCELCTNKNHSYQHNEQINNHKIDNAECLGVTFVKIYP